MKISEPRSRAAASSDVSRVKWPFITAILVMSVMVFAVTACPENIRVRTTDALHASIASAIPRL